MNPFADPRCTCPGSLANLTAAIEQRETVNRCELHTEPGAKVAAERATVDAMHALLKPSPAADQHSGPPSIADVIHGAFANQAPPARSALPLGLEPTAYPSLAGFAKHDGSSANADAIAKHQARIAASQAAINQLTNPDGPDAA